jgi:dsDNA-binding SOS-regulon protein
LAFEYINQIYQLKSSSKSYTDKCEDEEGLAQNREEFMDFLKTSQYYSPQMVLNKIKTSWMMEEIILLLVKLDKHSEALEIFIDKNMDKQAEQF